MVSGSKAYYKRNFVTLSQQEDGYSTGKNLSASGYCKIEIKNNRGKLTCHVQNLKPADSMNCIYRGYLIGKNSKGLARINTGIIELKESGKGDAAWDFNPDDINGTGLSVNNLTTVVIACCSLDGDMSIKAFPLLGYIDKRTGDEWKKAFVAIQYSRDSIAEDAAEDQGRERDKKKDGEKAKKIIDGAGKKTAESKSDIIGDDKNRLTEEDAGREDKREEGKGEFEGQEERQAEGKEAAFIEKPEEKQGEEHKEVPDEAYKDDEQKGEYTDEDLEKMFRGSFFGLDMGNDYDNAQQDYFSTEEEIRDDRDRTEAGQSYRIRYWDTVEYFFVSIFSGYKKVEPFEHKMEGHDWRKIWIDYTDFSGMYRFIPMYYYMHNSNLEMYKHYLIGLVHRERKIRYIVYGLPGRLLAEEQPYGGMTGYLYWYPVRGKEKIKGAHGYWLMYIDADTGQMVKPFGETKIN